MEKRIRIYEIGRGSADNIRVIDKLTLFVQNIDERTQQVVFIVNPNIVEYSATRERQRLGFESMSETRLVRMAPNSEPIKIAIEGTVYTIAVVSIGTTQDAQRLAYCDFVITSGA